MRCVIILFVLAVRIDAGVAAQRPNDLRCVIVPSDQAVVAVAAQPDSPLVFEDVRVLSCVGRPGIYTYKLRNRGTKPIKGYTVSGWSSGGTGFKSGWGATASEGLIMPGQLAPIKDQEVEILPLTKQMRKEMKLDGPMEGVMILMVASVEYADGSTFNDEVASTALEAYFEKVGAKVH